MLEVDCSNLIGDKIDDWLDVGTRVVLAIHIEAARITLIAGGPKELRLAVSLYRRGAQMTGNQLFSGVNQGNPVLIGNTIELGRVDAAGVAIPPYLPGVKVLNIPVADLLDEGVAPANPPQNVDVDLLDVLNGI